MSRLLQRGLSAVLLMVFVSCGDAADMAAPQVPSVIQFDHSPDLTDPGSAHNELVRRVYKLVKSNAEVAAEFGGTYTKDDMYATALSVINQFAPEVGGDSIDAAEWDEIIDFVESDGWTDPQDASVYLTSPHVVGSQTFYPSSPADTLHDSIRSVLDDSESLTDVQSGLQPILASASGLSGYDEELVIIHAFIADSSASYWDSRLDEWWDICDTSSAQCSYAFLAQEPLWRKIIKGVGIDAIGALAGGVHAGAPGAVVTGGAMSAVYAISQL